MISCVIITHSSSQDINIISYIHHRKYPSRRVKWQSVKEG